jgi:hypothetical protein
MGSQQKRSKDRFNCGEENRWRVQGTSELEATEERTWRGSPKRVTRQSRAGVLSGGRGTRTVHR